MLYVNISGQINTFSVFPNYSHQLAVHLLEQHSAFEALQDIPEGLRGGGQLYCINLKFPLLDNKTLATTTSSSPPIVLVSSDFIIPIVIMKINPMSLANLMNETILFSFILISHLLLFILLFSL